MGIVKNIASPGIKFFVRSFGSALKRNKEAMTYHLGVSLKDEVEDYIENVYYKRYLHIEKAIELVKRLGNGNGSILDVGGGHGTTAAIFHEKLPASPLVIFEPIKSSHDIIVNKFSGINGITVLHSAAGSASGKSTINKAANITSSSILPLDAPDDNSVLSGMLKSNETEDITITTLDEAVKPGTRVEILKIDAQGFEVEVLKGAVRTLKDTRVIVVELNNHNSYVGAPKYYAVDQLLRDNNFTLYDIFPSFREEGRLKEWDTLYIHNSLLK